ncbi:MAG: ATP synthase F1 subunit epsilon [Prosthecobacter sp.]|jgi:F-type H+-transporting ATPase subunit epsilon|uniref:ATP synthase F1 subunit epsilon n=1 Tax=Prosthecobacter sp. TaxID=1965333 RepID=UPI001A065BC1|nr:ATP synthase F1 subunit epsilon [Prosthecobacter sp.]MBE2286591.1 ATP synthase F1 subunit epsilon [Prosthecobacter sp.]
MPLKLEIVTPEARIFSDEVDTVVLPGYEGEMGVLPAHANLVTTLKPGELRITKGGKTTEFAVGEGLVEVTGTATRILTDLAIDADKIDEAAVQEALDRAQKSLADLKPGEQQEEVAAVMAIIQRSTAQLHLKRKRRTV